MNELVAEILVTIAAGAAFMAAAIVTVLAVIRDRPPIVRDAKGRWRALRRP